MLDVGCGGGAASAPLADKAGSIIGVDATAAMLAAFAMQLGSYGPAITTIQGSWPDLAAATPSADVVVCHHVAYNVSDLPASPSALPTTRASALSWSSPSATQ